MQVIGATSVRIMELLLLLLTNLLDIGDHDPVTFTKTGRIRGMHLKVLDKDVHSYLGIPYATPPVGELRFKPPLPVEPWNHTYEATKQPTPCYQPFLAGNSLMITPWVTTKNYFSEDCLYLNVWTPKEESANGTLPVLKPVLVFIYGGGLLTGSIDVKYYDGRILAAYGDVVVVTMNYRLGLLGFFSSRTPESPGNMGFMDQAMALKWVQENIVYFGGDPDQIVLFGQSAGAISIGLHMISPMSRNLFKRAIVQSGSPFFISFLEDDDAGPNRADLFARGMGCSSDNMTLFSHPDDVVECLRRAPIERLNEHVLQYSNDGVPRFGPTFGNEFMPENPLLMVRNGNVGPQKELLIGNVRDEGPFFLHYIFPEHFGRSQPNVSYEQSRQLLKSFLLKAIQPAGVELILTMYFSSAERQDPQRLLESSYQLLGDLIITCSTLFFAEDYAALGRDVRYYRFTYRSDAALFPEWAGVTHFEEVPFIFGYPLLRPAGYSVVDVQFSKRLMDTWLQFAKTGTVPDQLNIPWPSFSKENNEYLELHPHRVSIERDLRGLKCDFWRYIYESRM